MKGLNTKTVSWSQGKRSLCEIDLYPLKFCAFESDIVKNQTFGQKEKYFCFRKCVRREKSSLGWPQI